MIKKKIIKNEVKEIVNRIYNEQKDYLMNKFLPEMLEKGLIIDNKEQIFSFMNQQITLSLLNGVYKTKLQMYNYEYERYHDEFLTELVKIFKYSVQGMFLTSEYVGKNFKDKELVDEIINCIYYDHDQFDLMNDYTLYVQDLNFMISSLPTYFGVQLLGNSTNLIKDHEYILFNKYSQIAIKTIKLFLEFTDLFSIEKYYKK